jgi:SAM-dependent methyltransferase
LRLAAGDAKLAAPGGCARLLGGLFMAYRMRRSVLSVAVAWLASACTSGGAGDGAYRPLVGQGGKDVMWVPTLDGLVMQMLEAAEITRDDLVFDLGSGDGRIPIWAARRFGARAVGIEYDAKLSALAQRNAERAGVTDRVRMIHGDIFREDFSAATVLTLYLGQALNLKLRPTILGMKPGTRVVSNLFDMGDWEPDRILRIPDQNPVFVWIVPAVVDGAWTLASGPDGPARLRLDQRFQRVRGTLTARDGKPVPVAGSLRGRRLVLKAGDDASASVGLEVEVDGETLRDPRGTGVVARRLR